MRPPERDDRRSLYGGAAWSLLALLTGLLVAGWLLPEWRTAFLLNDNTARQRYREMAHRAGLRPVPGEARVSAVRSRQLREAYRTLGEAGDEWLAATQASVLLEVSHRVRQPEGKARRFEVRFSPRGEAQYLCWGSRGEVSNGRDESARFASMAHLLLQPGESLGPPRRKNGEESAVRFAVRGSRAPTHLVASSGDCQVQVERRVGELAGSDGQEEERILGFLLLFLGVAVLFLVFALRARLSIVHGLLLALAAELTVDFTQLSNLPTEVPLPNWVFYLGFLVGASPRPVSIFLAWSVGESLLRLVRPEIVAGLDGLRHGDLGRRAGRALLSGLGWGLALAGLRLGLLALAVPVPGVSPDGSSVILPPSSFSFSALGESLLLAAWMALVVAVAVRLLPARRALWVAAAAGGGLLALLGFSGMSSAPIPLTPWPAFLIANVVVAGVLSYVTLRFGLAGVLAASSSYLLIPTLLLASRSISWWPVSFAVMAAVLLALLALGWRGATRAGEPGDRRLRPPAFLARLEEERRLREMDLLARIQAGLLPREMPRVEGWDLAARSVLAHEAGGDLYDFLPDGEGRLWIAAGDVAGHGPSCAIALAMTKAALATLANASRSPAEVLRRVDHVLRSGGAARSFTTLALVRLDPRTGEAVLANAAHPYPLLLADGAVSELELPGLPLGQGPRREYREISFRVPPGGVLAFVSDGLLEALDGGGTPYGFDAAKEVLRSSSGRSASEVLEALMAAWRHHLGSRPPDDDTTVVIVARMAPELREAP